MGLLERLNGLVTELWNEKDRLSRVLDSQTFSSKTHDELKQRAYRKIVLKKNEIYDTELNRIREEMDKIRRKYEYSEMSAERELLQFKKIEANIKALPNNELEQKVRDFVVDKGKLLDVPLKPDYINIVVSELRDRGLNELAESVYEHFYKVLIGNEPWKADSEYKALEKELNKMETLKSYQDAIMLTDGTKLNPTTYYISQELGLSDIEIPEIEA